MHKAMSREELLRVTAQIRAWDKNTVAFGLAIQQIQDHDMLLRTTIQQQAETTGTSLACRTCAWQQEGGGLWVSACGEEFCINDDHTPDDCRMRFCCFCGKRVEQVLTGV